MADDSPPSISVIDEKLRLIVEAVKEIDAAIESRDLLTRRFLDQIDRETSEVRFHLSFLGDPWKHGFVPAMESMRITLHKNLTSRRVNRRAEELAAWTDRLSLVEKRRQLVMEYQTLLAARRQHRKDGPG